jgi:hypothetical protein
MQATGRQRPAARQAAPTSDAGNEDIMSVVDVLIPLIAGILLVARPQIFFKHTGSDEEMAKKQRRMRTIGYVLLGVAALYAVIALAGKR